MFHRHVDLQTASNMLLRKCHQSLDIPFWTWFLDSLLLRAFRATNKDLCQRNRRRMTQKIQWKPRAGESGETTEKHCRLFPQRLFKEWKYTLCMYKPADVCTCRLAGIQKWWIYTSYGSNNYTKGIQQQQKLSTEESFEKKKHENNCLFTKTVLANSMSFYQLCYYSLSGNLRTSSENKCGKLSQWNECCSSPSQRRWSDKECQSVRQVSYLLFN